MSDFSSIHVSAAFPLPAGIGHDAPYFQTTDLPADPCYGACIAGAIESDGLFVRTDSGARRWNPHLTGWAYFRSVGVNADFVARFEKGRAVQVMDCAEVFESDIGIRLPSAARSPNIWRAIG